MGFIAEMHKTLAAEELARLEHFAEELANRLGVQPHLCGRDYLVYAITLCACAPELGHCLTKELYPQLAVRFGTTTQCVERSLRNAIAHAWTDAEVHWRAAFSSFRSFNPCVRPTAGQAIVMAATMFRMENCGSDVSQ